MPPPVSSSIHSGERKHWLDYATFGVEVLGFLGLAVYCVLNLGILRANRDAVKTAQEANRLTIEATRARLTVTSHGFANPIGEKGITSVYLIQNVGKSTAYYGLSEATPVIWNRFPDGDMPLSDPVPSIPLEVGAPPIQAVTGYTGALSEDFLDDLPTASKAIGLSSPTRPTVYFFGKVVYESIGTKVEIEFCSYLGRADYISDGMGYQSILGADGKKYVQFSCPRWNSQVDLSDKK